VEARNPYATQLNFCVQNQIALLRHQFTSSYLDHSAIPEQVTSPEFAFASPLALIDFAAIHFTFSQKPNFSNLDDWDHLFYHCLGRYFIAFNTMQPFQMHPSS